MSNLTQMLSVPAELGIEPDDAAVEAADLLLRWSPDRARAFALAMHERTAWIPESHWHQHWTCILGLVTRPRSAETSSCFVNVEAD